jgi:hypothetical protein
LYTVGSNVAGVCLYRDGKVVLTFEKVFDVIQEANEEKIPEATTNTTLIEKEYNEIVCYTVELTNTIDGYMITLGGNLNDEPYIFNCMASFQAYK